MHQYHLLSARHMRFALLLALLVSTNATARQWVISPEGFGPVRIGMTVKAASKALGVALVPDAMGVNPECYHVSPPNNQPPVALMIEANRVSRIYAGGPGVRSDRGIRTGDSEENVRKAYGTHLIVEPHHYVNGHYMFYWLKRDVKGIMYETDNGKVISIDVGGKALHYVEGCL